MYTFNSIIIYLLIIIAPIIALEVFNYLMDLKDAGAFLKRKKRHKAKVNKY